MQGGKDTSALKSRGQVRQAQGREHSSCYLSPSGSREPVSPPPRPQPQLGHPQASTVNHVTGQVDYVLGRRDGGKR